MSNPVELVRDRLPDGELCHLDLAQDYRHSPADHDLRRVPDTVGTQGDRLDAGTPRPQPRRQRGGYSLSPMY